ncbi:hypothetical protein OPQ81_008047 [Rhizoctonia solani]|nr:hypothetical protein OPQ81_008047 [Rhizoctonia solani]
MSELPVFPVASQASVSSSHIAAIYAITDDNPYSPSGRVSPALSIISASSVTSQCSRKFSKKDKNSQVILASSRIHSPIDKIHSPKRKTPSITDHIQSDKEGRSSTPTQLNPIPTHTSTQSDIPDTQTTEDINQGDIGINIQHAIDNIIKDINNALNPKTPRMSIIDNTDDLLNAILIPIFQNINDYPTFTDALHNSKVQLAHRFSQAFEDISNKFGSLAYSLEEDNQPEVSNHMDEDEDPIATNTHTTWGQDITAELTWDSYPTPTQPPHQPSTPTNHINEALKTIIQQMHSLQAEMKEIKQKVFAPKANSSASVHTPAPSQAPSASAAPNIHDFPALPPPNSNKPKPTSYASAAQAPKAPTPKVSAKAIPSVSREIIQSAIKRDLADKSKRLCVHFESMPLIQPSPERIAIAMSTVLRDHQITLGGNGSYLLKANWTSKGALSLTFSPQTCIPAAKRAIELLVAHLQLPKHEASTEEGWSRLAIVGLPTGINSEIHRVYNSSELSNIIDASPLKDLGLTKDKYTLEPSWISRP